MGRRKKRAFDRLMGRIDLSPQTPEGVAIFDVFSALSITQHYAPALTENVAQGLERALDKPAMASLKRLRRQLAAGVDALLRDNPELLAQDISGLPPREPARRKVLCALAKELRQPLPHSVRPAAAIPQTPAAPASPPAPASAPHAPLSAEELALAGTVRKMVRFMITSDCPDPEVKLLSLQGLPPSRQFLALAGYLDGAVIECSRNGRVVEYIRFEVRRQDDGRVVCQTMWESAGKPGKQPKSLTNS